METAWPDRPALGAAVAPSHKNSVVRATIRAAGAKLFFLPPYSPDLDPIEQMFSKLKTLLRKAAERTMHATRQRIGSLLDEFKPDECGNDLTAAGYAARPDPNAL